MHHNSRKFHARIILIPAVFVLLLLCISPVSAIGVSGAKYMGTIAPGTTYVHDMTVRNAADEPAADVVVDVMGFGESIDKSYLTLGPEKDALNPYSARQYISIDNTTFHLEPGTSKVIKATITIPSNVGAGGRYAIIYIHALPGKDNTFTTGVEVPVLVTISGTTPTLTGSITGLEVGDVVVGEPITITTSLKNTGNHHYYRTVNTVTLTDASGKIVANVTLSPAVEAIIPGYTVAFVAKPEIKDLPLGTYTVNSKVLLEDGKVLDEKTTTFSVSKNYAPPITETSVALVPGSAGTLKSSNNLISVLFPQGAVLGDAIVTLKPYTKANLKAAPSGAKLAATCFEITGLTGLLSKDATIKVTYSAEDLAAAGGDASQLKLAYYNAAQNSWVILPTQVDTSTTTLTTTTNHLSVWTVMVSTTTGSSGSGTSSSSSAPGATTAKGTSLQPMVILISIGIAVAGAGYHFGKRK